MVAHMSDKPFHSPKAKPARPMTKPGDRLFVFYASSSDRTAISCDLHTRPDGDLEVRFLVAGELLCWQRFATRAAALQWAGQGRKELQKGGA
jgi:hypothetical protein